MLVCVRVFSCVGGACVQVCLCMHHGHTFTVCEHLYCSPPLMGGQCNPDRTPFPFPTHFKSRLQRRQGSCNTHSPRQAWAQCRPQLTQGSIGRQRRASADREHQVSRDLTTSARAQSSPTLSVSNAHTPIHLVKHIEQCKVDPSLFEPRNTMVPFLAPVAFLWLLPSFCSSGFCIRATKPEAQNTYFFQRVPK